MYFFVVRPLAIAGLAGVLSWCTIVGPPIEAVGWSPSFRVWPRDEAVYGGGDYGIGNPAFLRDVEHVFQRESETGGKRRALTAAR